MPQVSKLVNGGAAAMSGSVDEGDFLEAVDGVDVRTWPLKKLANEMVILPLDTPCIHSLSTSLAPPPTYPCIHLPLLILLPFVITPHFCLSLSRSCLQRFGVPVLPLFKSISMQSPPPSDAATHSVLVQDHFL